MSIFVVIMLLVAHIFVEVSYNYEYHIESRHQTSIKEEFFPLLHVSKLSNHHLK